MRAFGRAASRFPGGYSSLVPLPSPASKTTSIPPPANPSNSTTTPVSIPRLPILPLTPSAFAPYGHVIQSYPEARSAPKSIPITRVNFDTANKYNHLAPLLFVPPPSAPNAKGVVNFCVFRCEPQAGRNAQGEESWDVDVLERHEFSSQSFVPMGGGSSRYLVVVASPGPGASRPL